MSGPPPYGPPPYGPPPYGPPPYGPPHPGWRPPGPPRQSRLRPPWRDAPPSEKRKHVRFAILGAAVPSAPVVAAVLLFFIGAGSPTFDLLPALPYFFLLLLIAGVMDLIGMTFMFSAGSTRSLGWGTFIAMLIHLIVFAFAALVFMGWCLESFPTS